MPLIAALFLFAADAPSAAAAADARTVAENGMLANIARLKTAAEIEELIAAHPELSDSDKAALRKTGEATANALLERAVAAEAAGYLAHLTADDLTALAAFARSDAAKAQRAAMPAVMVATLAQLNEGGEVHFKEDTAA